MTDWRLYVDSPMGASHNMARDELLLLEAAETGLPAVRLYCWEHLVLSVGRAQKAGAEIDLAACEARGVPLVRRATGGRAVLHGNDLTYAVAAPTTLPRFRGGIMPVYREVSQVLQAFFAQLGLPTQVKAYSGRERAQQASANCFATPSAFEIIIEGRKLVGSAQRLLPGAFLQHGSIPLTPQRELLASLFHDTTPDDVAAQMTDLESLGIFPGLGLAALQQRLADAFASVLEVALQPTEWSAQQEERARSIAAGYPTWRATEAPPDAARSPASGALDAGQGPPAVNRITREGA